MVKVTAYQPRSRVPTYHYPLTARNVSSHFAVSYFAVSRFLGIGLGVRVRLRVGVRIRVYG